MVQDVTELVSEFIRLNVELSTGYVSLSKYLETYTALDLLTNKEFEPILKKLAAAGIDLYLVLTVCVGLYIRLPKSQFTTLTGHLNRKENRIILRGMEKHPQLLASYQNMADRATSRYVDSNIICYPGNQNNSFPGGN